ncbi:pyridoxal phosphate-dependent aminotransferase [Saccharicrinis sp. FJH62]|uniref:pyridoxal phosphate-dependent aminotransferase n=1 Tax=Saccharicrinis sp. FJH62 TaxID=3344657 RepID=UPI0035D500EE
MKPSISKKVTTFKNKKSPIREIMDLANPEFFRKVGLDPADVISFSGGWVNHEAPDSMRSAYASIIDDSQKFHASGAYPTTIGMPECRKAIVDFEKHIYGDDMDLSPEQIAIGANSSQMTANLMNIILDEGDKICMLDPTYANYPAQASSIDNIEVIHFSVMDTENWKYVANERKAEFAAFIKAEKPKMIMLCAPDNPTSQIPSTGFVKAALDAAKDIGAFLVIDFAYKELVWQDDLPEYFSWGPNDNYISIHSNSKWCRGLGRRLGWVEAPVEIISAFEAVQGATILCPDSLHQMALVEYIRNGITHNSIRPYIKETAKLYQKAAEQTVASIEKHLGMPCLIPEGGLYTVMKVDMDSSEFTHKILENTGVIVVPGWGFGKTLNNAVRLSYGPLVHHLDKIDEAMQRISKYLRG